MAESPFKVGEPTECAGHGQIGGTQDAVLRPTRKLQAARRDGENTSPALPGLAEYGL
jgi:hypothetical protein